MHFGENGLSPIRVLGSDFTLSGAIGDGRRRLNGTEVGAGLKKAKLQEIRARFTENMS